MNVLTIDIGGTNVKILATGQKECRKFPSGKTLTPRKMVAGVKKLAGDWQYDVVSIGYPGPVLHNRPVAEPRNLAKGWVGFNYRVAFNRPVDDPLLHLLADPRRLRARVMDSLYLRLVDVPGAGVAIVVWKASWVDSVASIVISVLVVVAGWRLLTKIGMTSNGV